MKLRYDETHFHLGRMSDGRNIHVPLVSEEEGTRWFGKVCCPCHGIYDLYEREAVASTLASLVSFPVPRIEIVDLPTDIVNFGELKRAICQLPKKDEGLKSVDWKNKDGTYNTWLDPIKELEDGNSSFWNKMVIVEWIDGAATIRNRPNGLQEIKNLPALVQGLVFNLWFGNHDGNMSLNVIVGKDGLGCFVDFGYAGPGIKDDLHKNVNGESFDDFGKIGTNAKYYEKLLPRQLLDCLRYKTDEMPAIFELIVKAIGQLSDETIEDIIQQGGYNFYFPNSNDRMTTEFMQELCRRKNLLTEKINAYCEQHKTGKHYTLTSA